MSEGPTRTVARMIAAALREVGGTSGCEGWSMQIDGEYLTSPSGLADAFEKGLMPQKCIEAALRVLSEEQRDG